MSTLSYADTMNSYQENATPTTDHPFSASGIWYKKDGNFPGFTDGSTWSELEARVNIDDSQDSKRNPTFTEDEIFSIEFHPSKEMFYSTNLSTGKSVKALEIFSRNILTPKPTTFIGLSLAGLYLLKSKKERKQTFKFH